FLGRLLSVARTVAGRNLRDGSTVVMAGLRAIAISCANVQIVTVATQLHRDRAPSVIRVCLGIVAKRVEVPEIIANRFKGLALISPVFGEIGLAAGCS